MIGVPRDSDAPHQLRNIAPDVVQTLWQLAAWLPGGSFLPCPGLRPRFAAVAPWEWILAAQCG